MALPSKALEEVQAMPPAQRTKYFEEFAHFIPDSRRLQYAIQVGSKLLMSGDTMDLRQQFDRFLNGKVQG